MIPSNSPCWGSERLSNMAKLPVPKWNSKDCKAGLPDFKCPASFPLSTHAEKYRGSSMARGCCGQYWSLASSLSASLPLWAALSLMVSTPQNQHPLQHPPIWLQGEQWTLLVYQLILTTRNTQQRQGGWNGLLFLGTELRPLIYFTLFVKQQLMILFHDPPGWDAGKVV